MRTFLLSLLLCLGTSLFAQVKTADPAYLKQLASATCECFDAKMDADETANAQMALGVCMITYINENRAEAEKNFGPIEFTNTAAMTKIGEQVGVEMAMVCPESMMMLVGEMEQDEAPEDRAIEITGTIKAVTFGSPTFVTIEEGNGRPVKCYWLEYFNGSEMLLDESAVGKQVSITCQNRDLFSGETREYLTRRVITALEVQ